MEQTRKRVDLNGDFRFKVDAKGRVSLPSKFRKVLQGDLVVTPDVEGKHLMVFRQEDFNEWVDELFVDRFGEYKPSSKTHQDLRRALKGRSDDIEIDKAGRILLPADQRELVKIERNVAIIGNTGYIEIWDAESYDARNDQVDITVLLSK